MTAQALASCPCLPLGGVLLWQLRSRNIGIPLPYNACPTCFFNGFTFIAVPAFSGNSLHNLTES